MEFPWYSKIENSERVTQGDIISNCMIPSVGEGVYANILKGQEGELNFDIDECNIIILSQACDISNNKIANLIVCPVWDLKELIEKDSHFKSSDARESLRQGKEPAYHLLNESSLIPFPFSVVDFHRIYSMPKHYIQEVAKSKSERLRLLPPYREHLSQAFARYFMRVGLPQDIDKAKIKEITKQK